MTHMYATLAGEWMKHVSCGVPSFHVEPELTSRCSAAETANYRSWPRKGHQSQSRTSLEWCWVQKTENRRAIKIDWVTMVPTPTHNKELDSISWSRSMIKSCLSQSICLKIIDLFPGRDMMVTTKSRCPIYHYQMRIFIYTSSLFNLEIKLHNSGLPSDVI